MGDKLLTQNAEELSDFNEVDSRELRDYNRGAILANILEKYSNKGAIEGERLQSWLGDTDTYLKRIPVDEQETAKVEMRLHLVKRGVIHG